MLTIWKCRLTVGVSILCAVFEPDGWVAVQCTSCACTATLFIHYSSVYVHKQVLFQLRITARGFSTTTFYSIVQRASLACGSLCGVIGPKLLTNLFSESCVKRLRKLWDPVFYFIDALLFVKGIDVNATRCTWSVEASAGTNFSPTTSFNLGMSSDFCRVWTIVARYRVQHLTSDGQLIYATMRRTQVRRVPIGQEKGKGQAWQRGFGVPPSSRALHARKHCDNIVRTVCPASWLWLRGIPVFKDALCSEIRTYGLLAGTFAPIDCKR